MPSDVAVRTLLVLTDALMPFARATRLERLHDFRAEMLRLAITLAIELALLVVVAWSARRSKVAALSLGLALSIAAASAWTGELPTRATLLIVSLLEWTGIVMIVVTLTRHGHHRPRLWFTSVLLMLVGCSRSAAAPSEPPTPLPAASTSGSMTLESALAHRRSQRTFAGEVTSAELAQLLWAAQGITEKPTGKRTAPAAGALYSLDVYVARADALLRYRPEQHALERVVAGDRRGALAKAALDQEVARAAPTLVVLVGTPARLRPKYLERSERYMFLEAGHAAQNLLLQAHALGVAAVPIGAFDDDALRATLGVGAGVTPIYVIPIGRAKT